MGQLVDLLYVSADGAKRLIESDAALQNVVSDMLRSADDDRIPGTATLEFSLGLFSSTLQMTRLADGHYQLVYSRGACKNTAVAGSRWPKTGYDDYLELLARRYSVRVDKEAAIRALERFAFFGDRPDIEGWREHEAIPAVQPGGSSERPEPIAIDS